MIGNREIVAHNYNYMKIRKLLFVFSLIGGMSLGKILAVPPAPTLTPPPTSTPSTPTGIPLDGGVLLLAAAGAVYGVKSIYMRKRKK